MIRAADYMTAEEIEAATERLRKLEREELLPAETIRDLWRWWREKLSDDRHPNVIQFPTWRARR